MYRDFDQFNKHFLPFRSKELADMFFKITARQTSPFLPPPPRARTLLTAPCPPLLITPFPPLLTTSCRSDDTWQVPKTCHLTGGKYLEEIVSRTAANRAKRNVYLEPRISIYARRCTFRDLP